MKKNTLWTRDFTIITLGTVVSMLGNSVSGFAMGLLVLDYSGSVMLYALTMVVTMLPSIIVPVVAGPLLDRFSRKKTIYMLDFLSAGIYCLMFFLLRTDYVTYPMMLFFALLLGSISSIYNVAYDSLYPNLITEGNFRKAYSISSMLYPLSAMMMPVAALVYKHVGVPPLLLFNAVTFFIAAVFETQIKTAESYVKKEGRYGLSGFLNNFREGIRYIAGEKGLQAITVYFCLTMLCGAASDTLVLPYFRATPGLGELTYSYIMAVAVAGRAIGGFIHYRFKYPTEKKFAIAVTVYISISVLSGLYLYTVPVVMGAMQFLMGFMGVTSYNIRISATQNYVPDAVRARFNGAFGMICSSGTIAGQLIAGALGDVMNLRTTVLLFAALNVAAALAVMLPSKKYVAPLYNVDV